MIGFQCNDTNGMITPDGDSWVDLSLSLSLSLHIMVNIHATFRSMIRADA